MKGVNSFVTTPADNRSNKYYIRKEFNNLKDLKIKDLHDSGSGGKNSDYKNYINDFRDAQGNQEEFIPENPGNNVDINIHPEGSIIY